jgi:hypothetical protein
MKAKTRKKTSQVTNVKNERTDNTTLPTDFSRTIRGQHKRFYANKSNNLNEMDKCLEEQQDITQGEIN